MFWWECTTQCTFMYHLIKICSKKHIYLEPFHSLHRKWIETKMTNPKFCAPGANVGNKVEARRCPLQIFVTMCRMLEEFSTNVILMISDSFSIPVPLLMAAYVLLSLIIVNSMYNDAKTSLEKFKLINQSAGEVNIFG